MLVVYATVAYGLCFDVSPTAIYSYTVTVIFHHVCVKDMAFNPTIGAASPNYPSSNMISPLQFMLIPI